MENVVYIIFPNPLTLYKVSKCTVFIVRIINCEISNFEQPYTQPAMPRKKPFSHKQKKEQMKQKREKKNETGESTNEFVAVTETNYDCTLEPHVVVSAPARRDNVPENASDSSSGAEDTPAVDVVKVNEQPLPRTSGRNYDPNRYHHWDGPSCPYNLGLRRQVSSAF